MEIAYAKVSGLVGLNGEPIFSLTASLRFEETKSSSHFLITSGTSCLILSDAFLLAPPVVAAPEVDVAVTVTLANTTAAPPTAQTESAVASAAFCGGGTHTVVVTFEFACVDGGEVENGVGLGVDDAGVEDVEVEGDGDDFVEADFDVFVGV